MHHDLTFPLLLWPHLHLHHIWACHASGSVHTHRSCKRPKCIPLLSNTRSPLGSGPHLCQHPATHVPSTLWVCHTATLTWCMQRPIAGLCADTSPIRGM